MESLTYGAASCWVSEVTKLKDLDAVSVALEDNKEADVHIRLVYVLTKVPCAMGVHLPVSFVDEKEIKDHEQKIFKEILLPVLKFLSKKKVKCSAHVERNDQREMGLTVACRRYGAGRLYISFKKRVLGNPLTGLDAIVDVLTSRCQVVAVYGGKRVKEAWGQKDGLDLGLDMDKCSPPRLISSQGSLSGENLSGITAALSEMSLAAASVENTSNLDGPSNLPFNRPHPLQQSSISQHPPHQPISPLVRIVPNEMFCTAPPGLSKYRSPQPALRNTHLEQYMMPGQSNGSWFQRSAQGMMAQLSHQMTQDNDLSNVCGGDSPERDFSSEARARALAIPLDDHMTSLQQQEQWMEMAPSVLMPGVLYSSDGARDVVHGATAGSQ